MPRKRSVRYAWLKIKDVILDEIFDGKYRPGDRVATVAALAERCGVSTTTVRQAIAELASEGVLEVRQGRGTVVASPKIDYDPMKGFVEQAPQLGGEPRTELYQTQWVVPHPETIHALRLRKGQKAWEVIRLHYLDEEPVMVEVTVFVRKVAETFVGDTRRLTSIFHTLAEKFGDSGWGVAVASVRITTERVFSDLLDIPRRTTFYHVERVVSAGTSPLLVSFLVLRSDRFQLRFRSNLNGGRTSGVSQGAGSKPV